MNVGEIAEQVTRAMSLCDRAIQLLTEAARLLEEAGTTWATVTAGTNDPDAAMFPGLAAEAAASCAALADNLRRTDELLRNYLASIGATPAAVPPAAPPPQAGKPTPSDRPDPGIPAHLAPRVADARERIAALPVTSQARGEWVQANGDTLRVSSGNSDTHYEHTDRYLRDHHGPRAARLATHVEIKVAATMRRDGLTDETVVMDRTVCGTRDNDRTKPLTCDKYLPRVLPPGGRLRVVEPDGTIKVYEGRSDQ